MFKVGFGYDVHRLTTDRKLILGGVDVDYQLGLAGHSDADVLTHAIADAVLGAAGLGDIGQHFPDNNPEYKGISSLLLLEKITRLITNKGMAIGNVDATIVAQQPKLSPYKQQMKNNLEKILNTQVNIKATTTEGLGFTGQGEGIAAYAMVLIYG